MDIEAGRKIVALCVRQGTELHALLKDVEPSMADEEVEEFTHLVAHAIGGQLYSMMAMVFAQHPSLVPEELRLDTPSDNS